MRRALAIAVAVSSLVAACGTARADGFALERYEPTPAGSWFVAVQQPWYSSTRYFAAGLTLDYGHNPLLGGTFDPRFHETVAIVEHQLVGHVDVAGSFLDRVQLSLSLPIVLMERGTAAFGAAPIGGAAVGDLRFGAMVRLFGQPDRSRLSLHVGGYLWIPFGQSALHAGDQTARGLPELIAGGMLADRLRWTVEVGVLIRAEQTIGFGPASATASEFRVGAGIAWANRARTFHVGPELTLATQIAGPQAGTRYGSSLELLFAAQASIAKLILVGAGVGPGLVSMLGTPDVRALVRIAYAPVRALGPPRPKDSDNDGVPDAEDLCPQQAGTARGCPDADHDGVPDAEDLCPGARTGAQPDPKKPGCPLDSDEDGIPDAEDLCPNAKVGDKPDSAQKGCPADDDKDGIPDAEDLCPGKTPGAHPDPARAGCPLPDEDNDGVPDAEDACPKDPGESNAGDAKANGCPKLTIQRGGVFQLRSVHFETNKWALLPESFPILDEVARFLAERKDLDEVVIEGHADDRGTHEWNLRLSKHRAQAVVEYLVKKGIKRGRLSYLGFGDTKPIDPERTDDARAKNRRVEVRFPEKTLKK
jgi:OOP family OmpA-OmpF porin